MEISLDKLYVCFVKLASHEYQHSRRLPDGTWVQDGDNMRKAAQEVFDAHADKTHMIASVWEHGGWHLDYYKDGQIVGTANDAAVFDMTRLALIDKLNRMEREYLPEVRRPEYDA